MRVATFKAAVNGVGAHSPNYPIGRFLRTVKKKYYGVKDCFTDWPYIACYIKHLTGWQTMKTYKIYYTKGLIFCAIGITAIMSGQYGITMAGKDATLIDKATSCAAFVIFDLILALIAAGASNKLLTNVSAKILFVVLLTMSTLSGAGYMLGQSSKGQNMRVTMLEREVDRLDVGLAALNPKTSPGNYRQLSKQRNAAYDKLQGIIEGQGGEITASNAMYVYLGKLTGIDGNSLAAIMRIVAMVSLNLSGIVLSAWLNSKVGEPQANKSKNVKKKSQQIDNYSNVKKSVKAREVRPSVAAIAKLCGNNRARAGEYLKRLECDGIVRYNGHGKARALIA